MLKNNEPYRYAQPAAAQAKFSRLRTRATAQRRKTGPSQGTPPVAHRGSGLRTRAMPSLEQVYAAEQLPPPRALAAGERAMLDRHGLTPFDQSLHHARRIARGTKTQTGA